MSLSHRAIRRAIELCVVLVPIASQAWAAETSASEGVRSPKPIVGEQQVPTNKGELQAVDVARTALARAIYVPEDTLPVLSIEKRIWPNTGLGCAPPDAATFKITRHGYAVALATPTGVRHVHVAGRQSRICDLPPLTTANPNVPEAVGTSPPDYDLNAVVERSRDDLARQLKAPKASIRLVSFAATTWPDSTMNCATPYEQVKKKSLKGYRIQLRHAERLYVYHTDLVRTRVCPAIDPSPAGTTAQAQKKAAESPPPSTRLASRSQKTKPASATSSNYYGVLPLRPSP